MLRSGFLTILGLFLLSRGLITFGYNFMNLASLQGILSVVQTLLGGLLLSIGLFGYNITTDKSGISIEWGLYYFLNKHK